MGLGMALLEPFENGEKKDGRETDEKEEDVFGQPLPPPVEKFRVEEDDEKYIARMGNVRPVLFDPDPYEEGADKKPHNLVESFHHAVGKGDVTDGRPVGKDQYGDQEKQDGEYPY